MREAAADAGSTSSRVNAKGKGRANSPASGTQLRTLVVVRSRMSFRTTTPLEPHGVTAVNLCHSHNCARVPRAPSKVCPGRTRDPTGNPSVPPGWTFSHRPAIFSPILPLKTGVLIRLT